MHHMDRVSKNLGPIQRDRVACRAPRKVSLPTCDIVRGAKGMGAILRAGQHEVIRTEGAGILVISSISTSAQGDLVHLHL
jgi:hypothetical protein